MQNEVERIDAYTTALLQADAVKVAPDEEQLFMLRNGSESCVYFDHGEVLCQPDTFVPFVDALAGFVREHFTSDSAVLVNVDSKSSPHIVGALATVLYVRQIVLAPHASDATKKEVSLPDEIRANDILVVIDDVFTEGDTTAIDAVSLVRKAIAKAFGAAKQETHLIVGLLRGDPAKATRQLGRFGIKLSWLTTLEMVLEKAWPGLTAQQQRALIQGGYDFSLGKSTGPYSNPS